MEEFQVGIQDPTKVEQKENSGNKDLFFLVGR